MHDFSCSLPPSLLSIYVKLKSHIIITKNIFLPFFDLLSSVQLFLESPHVLTVPLCRQKITDYPHVNSVLHNLERLSLDIRSATSVVTRTLPLKAVRYKSNLCAESRDSIKADI